jgi:hypothetical protein
MNIYTYIYIYIHTYIHIYIYIYIYIYAHWSIHMRHIYAHSHTCSSSQFKKKCLTQVCSGFEVGCTPLPRVPRCLYIERGREIER